MRIKEKEWIFISNLLMKINIDCWMVCGGQIHDYKYVVFMMMMMMMYRHNI